MPVATSVADVEVLRLRLRSAGYRLREGAQADAFVQARREHAAAIAALAHHLGTSTTPLLAPARADQAAANTMSAA